MAYTSPPMTRATSSTRIRTGPKRLLLHKREIRKLHDLQKQQGYALIPLSVYFKDSRVKIGAGPVQG